MWQTIKESESSSPILHWKENRIDWNWKFWRIFDFWYVGTLIHLCSNLFKWPTLLFRKILSLSPIRLFAVEQKLWESIELWRKMNWSNETTRDYLMVSPAQQHNTLCMKNLTSSWTVHCCSCICWHDSLIQS